MEKIAVRQVLLTNYIYIYAHTMHANSNFHIRIYSIVYDNN